ncbi:MAG: hypothetical protein M1837_006806 [Sclerophora amabilis]|nr:MAG: hypothetical protein M1837_006806 [Sclerophora amabilis]
MPHVRKEEYVKASAEYQLEYVEVIHRHHKRTPYASNAFPEEDLPWFCDDEGLFVYGKPLPSGNISQRIYWKVYTSASNPFAPIGFNGTCRYPQITREGLEDSWQHGKDLFGVYHDLLQFLPDELDDQISFRVTNNVITSQVAGMVISAMYGQEGDLGVQVQVCQAFFRLSCSTDIIQPVSIDSLEPAYICPTASKLFSSIGVGSTSLNWTAHLLASESLYRRLDEVSGVSQSDKAFHESWDHYFDNLSSRLCHQKPLPCSVTNSELCVTQPDAEQVFRLGEYEYSYIYRDAPRSLQASTASYGVWVAELSRNIRNAIDRSSPVIYRHNIAHDGSISRLLSILQIDLMVWPGMGSEVVFEVYRHRNEHFVRILWGGSVLQSSNPTIGYADMTPIGTLLEYFDRLVGSDASKIQELCNQEVTLE